MARDWDRRKVGRLEGRGAGKDGETVRGNKRGVYIGIWRLLQQQNNDRSLEVNWIFSFGALRAEQQIEYISE